VSSCGAKYLQTVKYKSPQDDGKGDINIISLKNNINSLIVICLQNQTKFTK